MKGKEYLCTLKPMDLYFLGGERNFHFGTEGEADTDGKKSYYLQSEYLPQQSTLFGVIRYLMLAKAGLLSQDAFAADAAVRRANRDHNASVLPEQKALVGAEGFTPSMRKMEIDYGKLYGISPVFLINRDRHRLVRTPLNHVSGKEKYQPFRMSGPYQTDKVSGTLLPTDFKAKAGLTDSYVDIDDPHHSIVSLQDIFGEQERTRIGRQLDQDGYFKMVYRYLQAGYEFGFYCNVEEGPLPEKDIVYMGQGKSSFRFTCKPAEEGQESLCKQIQALPGCDRASVYYAVSDLFLNIDRDTEERLLYSMVEKKTFRTLNPSKKTETFLGSREKSQLFQLVRPGSVFYLAPEEEEGFLAMLDQPGLKQAGFNRVERLGGK